MFLCREDAFNCILYKNVRIKDINEDLYYKDGTVSQFIFLPPNNLVIPQRNRRPCNTFMNTLGHIFFSKKKGK